MEKSIENIWKEGFINEQALVVPRINNLYNKKSTHLIDRLLRTGSRNVIGIAIGAVLVFLFFTIIGSWPAGLALCLLLFVLAYYTRLQGQKLASIDKGQNSYHFLQSLQGTLQEMTQTYQRIYQYLYPMIVLLFGLGFMYTNNADKVWAKVAQEFPEMSWYYGLPSMAIIALLVFTVLTALLARPLYRFDIGIIYGPILRNLEEMLDDMQTLRQ
ncbi:MAG: hypothetical protein AAFZ63_19755 [Bacteroidota bacterium]